MSAPRRKPPLAFVMLACFLVFLTLGGGLELLFSRPDWSSPGAMASRFLGLCVFVLSGTVIAALLAVPPWTPRLVAWWAAAILARIAFEALARGGPAELVDDLPVLVLLAIVLGVTYLFVRVMIRMLVHPPAPPVPSRPPAP